MQEESLMVCPVAHMVALAIHDQAFELQKLNTTDNWLHVRLPDGQPRLTFHWRSSIRDRPIFREARDGRTTLDTPIHASQSRYFLRRIGRNMGLEKSLKFYHIRRGVANAIDGEHNVFATQRCGTI